jgi:putative hydrolase of the HAD superfamily
LIDTILFDNWNTLVEAPGLMTHGAAIGIFQDSLRRQGFAYDAAHFVDVYRRISHADEAAAAANGWTEMDYINRLMKTLAEMGVKEPRRSRLATRAWDDYLAEWPEKTRFFPEAPALLESLKGRYKLGVVTNFMDGPTARRVFDDLGYEAIFDSLVVSAEIGYMKPAPILFNRALDELQSKPENTVMVGDTFDADVVGAHGVGMRGVLIDMYGATPDQIRVSDAVIKKLDELDAALKRLEKKDAES